MKAVATQSGTIIIAEVEPKELEYGHVRIRTEYSAISPGTELSMVNCSSDSRILLGYSAVGIVEQVGDGVSHDLVGQRVACYGAPYVYHAEWLTVPTNLIALVPDKVDPKEAAFGGLGAIAVHALRVADLRFGESAVIVGLGTLGHLIAQIAHAAAYRTVALDMDARRAEMLRQHGLDHVYADQNQMELELSEAVGEAGADAVLLCVSGSGEEVTNSALTWIRDRGKVVIVGDLSMSYSRELMFQKEAQVLISRAGGPGRYDKQYEQENRDYPIGHVRWTEGRNLEAYIRLLADGRISMKKLITHVYPVARAEEAYDNYRERRDVVATLLQYGHET